MSLLDEVRFTGTLAGHGVELPIGFTAELDDDAVLNLRLDRIPAVADAYKLYVDQALRRSATR